MRIRAAAVLLLAISATSTAYPGVRRVGAEFQVSAYTTGNQGRPGVGISPEGDFVIVWSSEYQDGYYYGIFAKRFNSLGAPIGSEFQVNAYTTEAQTRPAIARDGSGGFVIAWTSYGQDGHNLGVIARRFDSGGIPLGVEFQVNTYTTSYQYQADVAAGPFGDFVVVWAGGEQDGSSRGIFAQRFDSGGMRVGAEFRVNTYTTSVQRLPAVSMDDSGAFVVIWESHYQDGDNGGIFGQRYDSAGMPADGEFQVNSYTTATQLYPDVAADPDGTFLVVWQSPKPATFGIVAQRYSNGGLKLDGEFQVASAIAYDQFFPATSAGESGVFVVVWEESLADGSAIAIVGRRIDATGTPVGGDFQVNTYTTNVQRHAAVGMNSGGDLVVAWESYEQDGDHNGVYAQRYVGRVPEIASHVTGDMLDCSDPAVTRPTFTWDPDGYDRFRVYLSSDPAFGKGTFVTSGDSLRPGTSWAPSAKKWRKACMKAIAANPLNPAMFIRVLGKDTDLGKQDRAYLRNSETVVGDVQP